MKHFGISLVALSLVSTTHSFPFIFSDDESVEDPFDDFLSSSTSTSTGEIVDDEPNSSLFVMDSGSESPLEDYPTVSEDWLDSDQDLSLQSYNSDLIATSPGIFFLNILSASKANADKIISLWTIPTHAPWARNLFVAKAALRSLAICCRVG